MAEKSTTRIRDRIFAGVGAAVFLITGSALTIAVIYDAVHGSNDPAAKTDTTSQTDTSSKDKLQGAQLQDFTPVANVDSLQKIDTKVGTGAVVKAGDTVTVDYTGALASTGVIFQSSLDSGQPVTFGLNNVIVGWQEGIPGMKVGGTRRLLIPSEKAYGAQAQDGIPANSDLVFDVTLHSIQ